VKRGAWLLWAIALIALAAMAVVLYVRHIPPSPIPGATHADPTLSPDSEYLARLADCVACHSTAEGQPFSGGLKMGTPMGYLYSSNITPDPDSGIGRYTLADFDNALRRGIAKDGHRLYPAMPYPSYAKLTDEDVGKLYGYFMLQVKPVHQSNRPLELHWPLNQRWALALWNALFVPDRPYVSRPDYSESWNRGAYFVQSLGHCGACHTERGLAFNETALDERSRRYLGGALLDGWYASDLRADAPPGLGNWSAADIVRFLKLGHNAHGTVFGSMLDAFNNSTQFMSDADLMSVAEYLHSLPGTGTDNGLHYIYNPATQSALDTGDLAARGATLYLKQCSSCHGRDGNGHSDLLPPLAGSAPVLERNPSSVINVILNGAGRIIVNGVPDSYRMTPFRVLLSDQDVADVATFIRHSWGNEAGTVQASQVQELRAETDPSSDHVIVLRLR
jgi:alcohol dehydrogenase (quinone), cytochrome c subunit